MENLPFVDVFPSEKGGFPAIAMLVYWKVQPKNQAVLQALGDRATQRSVPGLFFQLATLRNCFASWPGEFSSLFPTTGARVLVGIRGVNVQHAMHFIYMWKDI